MIRKANAIWRGSLKEGKGTLSSGSGVLSNIPYDFRQRFEDAPGTNPEELIAAAHSACFSMALSADLTKAGLTVESVETKATLTFEPKDGKPTITKIHLETVGKVPGTTQEAFLEAAKSAKANCPISRVLNTEITLDAKLA
jgi:osmotically inducible protein OsmC